MIGALLSLALIVAVAYGTARLVTGTRSSIGALGGGDLREHTIRLLRLGLQFAAIVLAAEGVSRLLGLVLEDPGEITADADRFAEALAYAVVGVPVAAALGWWTHRRLRRDPLERHSAAWAAYLTAVTSVALVIGLVAAFDTGVWALDEQSFDGAAAGRLIVWALLWLVHWRLHRRRPMAPTHLPVHVLIGTTIGLLILEVGAGQALEAGLGIIDDALWREPLIRPATEGLRRAALAAGLGAVVWCWYWLGHGVKRRGTDVRSATTAATPTGGDVGAGGDGTRWAVQVLLLGVLGNLVAALVGAGRLLHAGLGWFFAVPSGTRLATHFDFAPTAVAALAVGVLGWWYHRSLVTFDGTRPRTEVDRVYHYSAAAGGLVTAVTGMVIGAAVAVRELTNPPDADAIADDLVLAVTLFAVGAPVWEAFWWQAQRWSRDPFELRSVTRRVYLAVLFGLAAAVAMVGALGLLIVIFEDVTRERFGEETFDSARVPIGLVLSSMVVSVYHWWVSRRDRRLVPPVIDLRSMPLRDVTLVALDGRAERAALAAALGRPVRLLHPIDRRQPDTRRPPELGRGSPAGPPGGGPAASPPRAATAEGGAATATAHRDPAELDADVAPRDGSIDALIEMVRASEHSKLLILLRPDGSCEVLPVTEE